MAKAEQGPTAEGWPSEGLDLLSALERVAGEALWQAYTVAREAGDISFAAQLAGSARLDAQQQALLDARHAAWDACVKAFMAAWRDGKIRVSGCPGHAWRAPVDLPPGSVTLHWQRSTAIWICLASWCCLSAPRWAAELFATC